MTEPYPYHQPNDLPKTFPVFPLAGALLLPRARLPLNIFEPRYLNMVDDVLSSERLIGMIQPTDPEANPPAPPLYPVGCAGRITSFTETGDGRYLITLTGVCRYRIEKELSSLVPYRQVTADFAAYADDLRPTDDDKNVDRKRLLKMLKIYLETQNLETDWESVKQAPGEALINSLSMICPFGPQEKQALLEAPTLNDRVQILTALIEMANAPNAAGPERPMQ
jgi:Lon protease-like protein